MMIRKLTSLSAKRSLGGAIKFFLLYSLFLILFGSLIAYLISLLITNPATNTDQMLANGRIYVLMTTTLVVMYVHFLYIYICVKKNLKSFLYIALGIISILICIYIGWGYSMLIVSFLTTREAAPILKTPKYQ